jgi:hypothetical protein
LVNFFNCRFEGAFQAIVVDLRDVVPQQGGRRFARLKNGGAQLSAGSAKKN